MAELSGQGPIVHSQATTVATTDAIVKANTRARDVDGNEFIYCSFSETLTAGGWVVIRNGVASRLDESSAGPVGLVHTSVTSADNGWVQIYGVYDTAQIQSDGSDATSAYLLGTNASGATTEAHAVASSLTSAATNHIYGAWILAAASTATTQSSSAHSGVTVQVWLNYPYVNGFTLGVDSTAGTS